VLIVQKFGGTSVGTPARIRRVAARVAERHAAGDRVVVVVSAMGHTTDQLLELAGRVCEHPTRREMDMLLTAGERISMALLSMALNTRDVPAISFTGSQSGIITDDRHTRARILEIRPIRIGPELEKGKVVIVAGFQGVSLTKEITTLGRGGSDTTAVGLAAGLGADLCEIYTDVAGVMTADPRLVPGARLLPQVPWDTMLELAAHGAGVMHHRAVNLARRQQVPFVVRSTFLKKGGTLVEGKPIETGPEVAGVTGFPKVAAMRVTGLPAGADRSAILEAIDRLLDDPDRVMGFAVEEGAGGGSIAFHLPLSREVPAALETIAALVREHGGSATVESDLAVVTAVGTGYLDVPEISARAVKAVKGAGIAVRCVDGGNLSISVLVPAEAYGRAVQALHREFLGA
jgi:aspartate kinase